MRESTFSSAAHGTRTSIETAVEGRITFDMIQFVRRNYKLSSYSLNSVSAEFLGQQKEDVHYSIISDLQRGSDEDRRRLAVYCLKDAYLPQRLMDKLMAVVNYVEMARVTGVPLAFLLQRGQQIKVRGRPGCPTSRARMRGSRPRAIHPPPQVLSMLYRKAQEHDLVIPTMRKTQGATETTYEGATVIEVRRALAAAARWRSAHHPAPRTLPHLPCPTHPPTHPPSPGAGSTRSPSRRSTSRVCTRPS